MAQSHSCAVLHLSQSHRRSGNPAEGQPAPEKQRAESYAALRLAAHAPVTELPQESLARRCPGAKSPSRTICREQASYLYRTMTLRTNVWVIPEETAVTVTV